LDSMSSSRSYIYPIREGRVQVSTFRRRTFGKLEDVECCLGTLECEWVCVCVCVCVFWFDSLLMDPPSSFEFVICFSFLCEFVIV
jgi:hypothetical protein